MYLNSFLFCYKYFFFPKILNSLAIQSSWHHLLKMLSFLQCVFLEYLLNTDGCGYVCSCLGLRIYMWFCNSWLFSLLWLCDIA